MAKIKLLPEHVVNQIKAGEVVERPLNVVKELVENAIDAKATEIFIELLDGGKKLIRVLDNGTGMNPEDLRTSIYRHATSKLTDIKDLEKIQTFGFRGEALPSIGAVSRLKMRSREKSAAVAHELIYDDGEAKVNEATINSEVGTEVSVKDLFYNVPARLKFLKATASEFSHIHEFLVATALAYPLIKFSLEHNGRRSFSYPRAKHVKERFQQIFEIDAHEYAFIEFERGGFKLVGFAQLPSAVKPLPKHFITFVNGRYVKDKVVRAGVMQAYSGLVLKGMSPAAILFLTVPPHWIDVNAHPAKTEVRFADALTVQDLLTVGLQNSLKDLVQEHINTRATGGANEISANGPKFENVSPTASVSKFEMPSAPALRFDKMTTGNSPSAWGREPLKAMRSLSSQSHVANGTLREPIQSELKVSEPNPLFDARSVSKGVFDNAVYLGQFANCYLLFEVDAQLWVVDQHAFHERVLFEEYIRAENGPKASCARQTLLIPLKIELGECLAEVAASQFSVFSKLGFEVARKGDSLEVGTIPGFLSFEKAQSIFEEVLVRFFSLTEQAGLSSHRLVAKASQMRSTYTNEHGKALSLESHDVYHLFYATAACHAAVRAGEPLDNELVRRLMRRAGDVDFYAHCPHGRPVLRRFTEQDVSQWFLRT